MMFYNFFFVLASFLLSSSQAWLLEMARLICCTMLLFMSSDLNNELQHVELSNALILFRFIQTHQKEIRLEG